MTPLSEKKLPPTIPRETVEEQFKRLAGKWEKDVAYLSSLGYDHPAYREITRLGPDVVPLLLRDMELHHTHWFCALREITGANPVPADASGHIVE
ncbi:MAG TPA: hypothetical protein VE988_25805, partial [Gemmataceae bacterium]|nr:hypothetical protein [Gemmataceae bacterium]